MKYNFEQKRNDYQTPPELIEKILKRLNEPCFAFDTCCSERNIPAYFHILEPNCDGLVYSWFKEGGWNYCNPPFDECGKWVKKAYDEQQRGASSVLLIPVRTETKYWKKYILDNPLIDMNTDVDFLQKGWRFIHPETKEPMGVFKNALALVYFIGNKEDEQCPTEF